MWISLSTLKTSNHLPLPFHCTGNIVLHIMDPETRESYDLETLWTVGAAFDEKAQVSEEDLVGVRRPRDPMAPPSAPPVDSSTQAVT